MVILMLVGLALRAGADIRYHIINNQGKECFRYVIKDDLSYENKATAGFDYKTELCVHPWARSVVATNFRFYINREDAVADANGTLGAYFNEGDVISEVAPGKTEFYVRYSMKSADELAAAGFVYDPDGNMTYLIQIRERNAKGGKRRQVYYDTVDGRFEFGNPGEKNKDIPSFESSESFKLQTDLQYRFRVKSGDDPYNTYFYNGAGEGQNANGVMTVSGIARNDSQKAKERVSYETMIDNYDPETTTSIQTFFFVAANEHILQSSWSGQYIGKMFVVGAVGGKDYWMRDVVSAKSAGSNESYVPYMLVANGSTGNFTDPGFQLQCYQSWRNYDYSNDNTSLALFTPYENTHEVTYHIVNSETHKDAMTIIQRHGPSSPFNLANRDKLQRIGCTLSTDYYYSDRECTTLASGLVGTATDVYIPYTFNSTDDEIAELNAAHVVFSTLDNPTWLSLTIRESGTKKLVYDANNNVIQSNTNSTATPDATTLAQQTAQFAFIGDPYSFQVICKAADGKFAYVNPETLAYNNTANNVCFTDSPTDDQDKFAMVQGSTTSSFQIFQRDKFAITYRAFWDARGGGNQIRMYSRTAAPEVHADANLHATLTPKYNYTYNIVDNSGRIAIKYTIEQEVAHRLDGEHGHKAIPEAIYSPYLEGETLKFYTFDGVYNAANLTEGNKITQLPTGATNIYVRYTTDHLSEKYYPLDNTKNYFIQIGGKYVIHDGSGVKTQSERPSIEGDDKANNIWFVYNQDPYDITIRNESHAFNLLDNTGSSDTRFIIMNSEALTPAEGQIVLLFANGADISTSSNSQSIVLSGNDIMKANTERDAPSQQVIFTEAILERTYRLIDKQGKILLEYESKDLTYPDQLDLPAKWKSPLVSTYKYWLRSSFTISGDVYTLRGGQEPITSPAESTDGYIYVTYDIRTSDDDGFIDLDGRNSSTNYMYLLQFADGDEFYQEKSDGFMTTKTKAVYPYTNGDAGFYVYGSAQWEEQQYAASTRTRWAWILEGNDPYHTKISSFQTQTTESGVARHAYFRTYIVNYNDADHIVTGSVTDNSLPAAAGDLPSEYMILGTSLTACKLVTTETVGTGTDGYASTAHRVVNSFEQYWKNNPTAQNVLGDSKLPEGGDDVELKDPQRTLLKTADDSNHKGEWHSYEAWATSAPWVRRADGTTGKVHGKHEHWFQTINMGDGTMKFVRIDLNGVLILLDNHGWEVARKPMGRLDDLATKATRDAEIRKYDSPMVEQYTFWTNYDKLSGYHKYKPHSEGSSSKDAANKGTGTSLADYPEVKSNGMLQDLYVTYTVKPQFVNAYTGAATEDATTVNTSFLIRQGDVLAKTDGTSIQTDATHISEIDAGSVTLNNTDNPEFFWCLRPNFNIDAEMGYNYSETAGETNDFGEKTKNETEEDYVNGVTNGWHNGFDPYNVQIYSYKTYKDHETNSENAIKYFVTNAKNAVMVDRQHLESTDPADQTLSLGDNTEKFSFIAVDYDNAIIQATNATFLVVQDANGNMRLMPRFDQSRVIQGFSTLTTQDDPQPEDDKLHPQTTWLLRPVVYTYHVIDNLGQEALQYKLMSDGAPKIPAIFKSPLAKDFKFYATYTTPGTVSSLTNEITGSFADATGITENTVYVRYSYDPDSDTDELLQGMWYNAKLNGSDVKVTTEGVKVKASDSDDLYWRFMESAGDDSDPYAVTLWNGTPAKESDKRYILMGHSSGTGYALMQAGNASTTEYKFLDGTSTPAFAVQSDYTTAGTIDDTKKLTLTPVLKTTSVTYKIITNSGKVALTEENVAVSDESVLKLPEWMETPLMESDAYIFYSAATLTDGKYTVKGYPTTSPKSLDGNVVYVRYDYEKSKKAVESFGMPDLDGLPYNYSPLDLTGNVKYTIGITSNDNGRIWNVNTSTLGITEADVKVNTEMMRVARLWQFTGDDPYEVTIKNPSYSTTKVLAGKEPNSEASDDATPNDKYPLTLMKEPDDGTYTLNTFMVLKYNPKEISGKVANVDHYPGTLKFYVTGNDHLYMAQSNSLAGGVYIYNDASSYKERLAASGEPINPKNNTMIIYSSFFYRPVLTYHVITNDGKEALTGYSQMAGTTVEMPQMYQSPLLNSSDFSYYTAATKTDGIYTVTESTKMAASTAIADAAAKNAGDIYVRYTYSRANSPFKIATNIDDAAEDGTQLLWDNEEGLDLSGDTINPNQGGTWYTIANFQSRWRDNEDHGNLFGIHTDYSDGNPIFEKAIVKNLANGRAPSNKRYLWKLMGNDPYAIKIYNADQGMYLSVKKADPNVRWLWLKPNGEDGYYQTFMLLEAHANDNEIGDYGRDDEGNYKYQLQRWTSLIATGTQFFTPVTTNNDTKHSLSARDTWDFNNYNFSNYAIRMSSSEVVTRQILNMTAGGTTSYCLEFVKAPVTRKYHFHAVNQATGTVTWDAVLEHDWLQPLVLDDNIARQFCKYEKRNTEATGDGVTGTGVFQTRAALEEEGQTNAQFYHDADFTVRVKDAGTNTYDVYPEIGLEDIYNIYFKYQIDNTATVNGLTLGDITSTTAQIASDKAHYAETGRLDPAYYPAYNSGDNHGKWFFMVLDTDAAMSAEGDEGSRKYTGKQYFLRREDNGTVNWMNNAYTLHPKAEDNYKDWAPSRVAEWYKKGDNDPYREGRWLWTFVGTDPYKMRIVNMESVVGVTTNAEGVYSLAGADNCWTTVGKTTLSNNAIAYPVTIPTKEPTENQYWGLSYGYGSEQTFSLISTAQTTEIDGQDVNQPLYWNMQSRTINKVTTQSVEGSNRSSDRSNAIQLLPYVPVKYQDINLVIKREDHVKDYTDWKDDQDWSGKTEYEIKTDKADQLKKYDSGISLLYFTAAERTYVAGDKINLGTEFSLPVNVLRAFCKYTLYQDDYQTPYDKDIESTYYYTVTDGPYPTSTQATTTGTWSGPDGEGKYTYSATGDLVYDEDGKPVYTYVEADGITPAAGAQSIYVEYRVTSDIFLKTAPTKTEVETMAANNDHVYFMDFPTYDAKGNEITHHAFYDPEATTFIQTGDLSKNKDKNTGVWIPEKKTWSGSAYASNFTDSYNATQYRTADDRMVSTPEKLKWYFVGDPYKLQVFNTAGAWNDTELYNDKSVMVADKNTKQAQLARFNTVETNFKFVSDCVHIRLPNYTHIDNRANLIPTDERGVAMPEKAFPNRNKGKPYINDFYWECVPAASSEAGTFALRFKEDNDLLGYRNVYYYLGRDGKTMVYNSSEENPEKYHINLNYRPNNERYESGEYLGYHKANNDSTVIRLVQPVKVYITTNRAGDDRYSEQTNVTVDEYSGYYGLNETITGLPRHLQRKYVKYNDLTLNGVTSGTHSLTIGNATSSDECSTHSSNVFVTGSKINPIFKFSVFYNVDDLTADGIHLFSSCKTPSAPAPAELTWLDVLTGTNSWLYYDKTNVNGSGVENQTSRVSNYRRALSENKSGWNNDVNGWTDGLKGLHWAFVGDPYDFTILNRRRYEDSGNKWLVGTKATLDKYGSAANSNDSTIWVMSLAESVPSATSSMDIAAASTVGHWSLQMWKLGNADYYFLRTASLDKTTAGSDDSQTNNYWRMMAKHNGTNEFYAEPYALDDHSRYTSNKNNLGWNNYVTNDMRYSKTMNSLGIYEQRLQIRTAVAEDNDKADNDCFDAKVEIRTKDGKLRISKDKLEIKYGLAPDMLPYALRRYGCEYECYINYNEATKTGDLLTRLRDSTTPMDVAESVNTATKEYDALSDAITAAKAAGKNVTLTYVYTVTDEVAEYFTTASDALTEDYTWTNGYFAWDQTYSGTNVEVEYYVDVFDHYVYDANGQIIDAVYIKERRTRVVSNPDQAYPTTAFLNTHTNQVNVFADESTQSKDDRQKWALVGDPYEFTLKNYAQYLINSNATQLIDNNLLTQTTIQALAQPFAMGIDKDGNTFLSVIDGTSREITSNISFDFSTSSTKTTKKVGSGTNTNDPTGNTYDTDDVKPFKLASLLSYADIVEYHLVIAHQHSLDPADKNGSDVEYLKNLNSSDDSYSADEKKQRQLLRKHLLEYLKYYEIRKNLTGTYLNYTGNEPVNYKDEQADDIKTLLKQNGTMRDYLSYPIADYSVSRVGIGNHPQVPWYMKRQFCKYYLYQRDVMRSQPNPKDPYIIDNDGVECYVWINESLGVQEILPTTNTTHENDPNWYKSLNIQWVSIRDMSYWDKVDAEGEGIVQVTNEDVTTWGNGLTVGEYRKKPRNYDDVVLQNGKILDKLQEMHYNRKVVVDVVYEVLPETFQFAYKGRNTTAWYTMMTNNAADGLLNFSYKDGIGARTDRTTHYTNNYLWAPEGDPYGFLLRSRYATINGSGWRNVAMTTKGHLPKESDHESYSESTITSDYAKAYEATYTNQTAFNDKRIIHSLDVADAESTKSDGPSNAVYEMFTGDAAYGQSFLLHPTSAYIDVTNSNFESYYMTHETASNKTKLVKSQSRTLQLSADANWRLLATPDQLLPYFERAGYVGGLQPAVAQSYKNQDYYLQLSTAKAAGKQLDFKTTREIQELVYSGTFYKNDGTTVVAEGTDRPTATDLPMQFKSTNLVNMTDGYYRIKGFSLPRYVSGYRFKSELTNSKPLRFFEKTKDDAWAHTFADLSGFSDATPGSTVLRGNIELLPADFDPSSIFRFAKSVAATNQYTLSTQGLTVQLTGTATKMSNTGTATNFRLDDIGGATVTLRNWTSEPSNWDTDVKTNIKTRYLTSTGDGYSLSIDVNNELNQTDGTDIQDTKWLLQPVGIREEWPYNEMPLRVEVNKGGKDRSGNDDKYYYGSLYVPFDTRLGNTTDAAFTLTGTVTDGSLSKPGSTTMASVSQLNEMGNPQFVPAAWPVVIRTNNANNKVKLVNTGHTDSSPNVYAAERHYVNMYIPNVTPTTVTGAIANIKLKGEYLEQTLTSAELGAAPATKTIMVFGLPFEPAGVGASHNSHEYDTSKQVGFFTNDNWARETAPTKKAHTGSYPNSGEATLVADHSERNNKYLYHNKIYYVLDKSYSAPAPARYSIAIFDETGIEEQPLFNEVTDDVPWPCDVYDPAGRKVASHETPATLLLNHPGLPKGVYIFGGRKMIIK